MKEECTLCSGRGRRYTQPYGLEVDCDVCGGTGYKLNLGQLFEVKAIQGRAMIDIAKITGRKLLGQD